MAAVDVANLALVKLGDPEQIADIEGNNKLASLVRTHYPIIRKGELRKHIWSFARTQVELAADGDEPPFGKANRYSLPAGFIRLGKNPDADDWEIIGGYIHTDDDAPLELDYVADTTDTGAWEPLFFQVVASSLALTLAPWRTASTTKKADLKDDYRDIIAEARRINAIDIEPEAPPEDTWISVRRSTWG